MRAELQRIPRRETPYDLGTFRVLIVDDFPFITGVMASSLHNMGVGRVITATDGEEGKNLILRANAVQSSQNIDVALIDWLMPEFSGLELLRWIRGHKRETIKFLPVIICSAYASRDVVEGSRDAGANEVLVKPVSASKIAQRILHLIDQPRAYVRTDTYFGPNRRRKADKINFAERRLTPPEDITETHEQLI
jgi:two-component system, chemotaxis family, chemotaxis protein CheY